MEKNLGIVDLINIKLTKLLTKADDYLRSKDSGLFNGTATTDGLILGTTAFVVGYLGVAASMSGLPALSSIGDFANSTALSVADRDINVAHLISGVGGFIGFEFAVLSKVYRSVLGTLKKEVSGYMDCVKKDGEEVVVKRQYVLKSIENGSFYKEYQFIRSPQGNGYEDVRPTLGYSEQAAKLPYYMKSYFDANAALHYAQNSDKDVEIVRRECFKEAKEVKEAHKILNRINGIRDSYSADNTGGLKLR